MPYELAARLTWLFFGVQVSPMSVWRAVQRLGEAAGRYSDGLTQYHADSRSEDPPTGEAPQVVVLGVDGCQLGMQVRAHRRRRKGNEKLPAARGKSLLLPGLCDNSGPVGQFDILTPERRTLAI